MYAKCIVFLNQKGGVAKSTSTYNIAAAKAQEGKTVLMIDLDPQASLTIAAGLEPGEERLEGHSTCNLFDKTKDPLDSVFKVNEIEGLYLVPSDIDLARTERELISVLSGETKLSKAIRAFRGYFDYIFIDCPPQLGLLSLNAMVAADEAVIPCKMDYLSYRGLKTMIEMIDEVKEADLNPNLRIKGIIGTFYEANVVTQRQVFSKIQRLGFPILGTVRKSADISRNVVKGLPVLVALPVSKTAKEYQTIANQL